MTKNLSFLHWIFSLVFCRVIEVSYMILRITDITLMLTLRWSQSLVLMSLVGCYADKIEELFSWPALQQPQALEAGPCLRLAGGHTAPLLPPPCPPCQLWGSPPQPRTWLLRLLEWFDVIERNNKKYSATDSPSWLKYWFICLESCPELAPAPVITPVWEWLT